MCILTLVHKILEYIYQIYQILVQHTWVKLDFMGSKLSTAQATVLFSLSFVSLRVLQIILYSLIVSFMHIWIEFVERLLPFICR